MEHLHIMRVTAKSLAFIWRMGEQDKVVDLLRQMPPHVASQLCGMIASRLNFNAKFETGPTEYYEEFSDDSRIRALCDATDSDKGG